MIQAQIYIDQDDLVGTQPVHEFILHFLISKDISGATVFRGISGYGPNQHLNRPNDLFSFDETPMMVTFIDEDEKVKMALTELRKEYKGGLAITHKVEYWQ